MRASVPPPAAAYAEGRRSRQVALTDREGIAISGAIDRRAWPHAATDAAGSPAGPADREEFLMLFTRWKLLTGALGLSVGGLATLGGTTPPPAESPLIVRADQKVNVP